MDTQVAIDMSRDMIWTALLISMPVLTAGVAIGLVVGLLQALTQIQEQTIGTVLKILVMIIVLALLLPWMTEKMIDFSTELYTSIPDNLFSE
ncbi:MAG: flagellar biosynthetic protein FliQ [Planctomycetaceae bacterium]|jgi:flagellar biosynthetic protein FliQ|nr:flagellar biosynthetic protein FliQ [Planctomycetaceae bacterium]